jgi:hypothetical protein
MLPQIMTLCGSSLSHHIHVINRSPVSTKISGFRYPSARLHGHRSLDRAASTPRKLERVHSLVHLQNVHTSIFSYSDTPRFCGVARVQSRTILLLQIIKTSSLQSSVSYELAYNPV